MNDTRQIGISKNGGLFEKETNQAKYDNKTIDNILEEGINRLCADCILDGHCELQDHLKYTFLREDATCYQREWLEKQIKLLKT